METENQTTDYVCSLDDHPPATVRVPSSLIDKLDDATLTAVIRKLATPGNGCRYVCFDDSSTWRVSWEARVATTEEPAPEKKPAKKRGRR